MNNRMTAKTSSAGNTFTHALPARVETTPVGATGAGVWVRSRRPSGRPVPRVTPLGERTVESWAPIGTPNLLPNTGAQTLNVSSAATVPPAGQDADPAALVAGRTAVVAPPEISDRPGGPSSRHQATRRLTRNDRPIILRPWPLEVPQRRLAYFAAPRFVISNKGEGGPVWSPPSHRSLCFVTPSPSRSAFTSGTASSQGGVPTTNPDIGAGSNQGTREVRVKVWDPSSSHSW